MLTHIRFTIAARLRWLAIRFLKAYMAIGAAANKLEEAARAS